MYFLAGTETDAALVGRCLQGDTSAFRPLVERYQRPLFRLAMRMLGNREDADDVIQSAFLKAFQALDTYDPGRRFFSWLYRIAVNECLNAARVRRATVLIDDSFPDKRPLPDPFETADLHGRLRAALLQLPIEQREVIVLRHFGELTYAQLSEELEIPETTVKCRLYAARRRLGELLVRECT